MQTIQLEQAPELLAKAVEAALLGEEVVIARDRQPVAKVVPLATERKRRHAGLLNGKIVFRDGWDAPEDDFREEA